MNSEGFEVGAAEGTRTQAGGKPRAARLGPRQAHAQVGGNPRVSMLVPRHTHAQPEEIFGFRGYGRGGDMVRPEGFRGFRG